MFSDEYSEIADLYDHVTLYRDRPDIEFLVDAATASGGPVLEIGCGTGRVLLPTARAGIDIVGLDASPSMLAVCREQLSREGPDVQARVALIESDMRQFDLGRIFQLITIPFRPFQHLLTVDDQLAALSSIRRHLADDGRLILDLFNPSLDALATRPVGEVFAEEPPFSTPDGRSIVRRHRTRAHDRFHQVIDVELIYDITHPDGRAERMLHAFPMRYLFRFEAEHLLARAGFAVEQLYAGYDKSEYGSKYPGELVFLVRKNALTGSSSLP